MCDRAALSLNRQEFGVYWDFTVSTDLASRCMLSGAGEHTSLHHLVGRLSFNVCICEWTHA